MVIEYHIRNVFTPSAPPHYLAHHLETCMEQFLGSFVIYRLWSVVHHGIVTHQFKIRLRVKNSNEVKLVYMYCSLVLNNTFKSTLTLIFKIITENSHLKFSNCVVLIISNFVFHGTKIHRMFDDHWVTRSDCIRYWKWEESMGVFPGTSHRHQRPSVIFINGLLIF